MSGEPTPVHRMRRARLEQFRQRKFQRVLRLPRYLLREQELETLDLLKMDVAGSQWEVLFSTPASVLRSIRHILLEYHEVDALRV